MPVNQLQIRLERLNRIECSKERWEPMRFLWWDYVHCALGKYSDTLKKQTYVEAMQTLLLINRNVVRGFSAVYYILADKKIIGFAIVSTLPSDESRLAPHWEVSEFYIKPLMRRKGIGTAVFGQLAAEYGGVVSLSVLKGNQPAYAFWNSVAARHSGGCWWTVAENGKLLSTEFLLRERVPENSFPQGISEYPLR